MNTEEQQYLKLLNTLITDGEVKSDRTGVGTKSIFGNQMKFSLLDGKLPLLTTKKVFFKGVVEELLFFIRGERDTKKLESKGVNIWKGNTSREFLDKRGLINYAEGDMGPMYGVQWRNFNGTTTSKGVDQLKNSIDLIKSDPNSRRNIVTAYNPGEGSLGVLEPCHMFFQFNVSGQFLDCLFYMRSIDSFLGLPFNIASYSLLTHIIAKATNLKARNLVFNGGDTHLYLNHIDQAKEQCSRTPYHFPTLQINRQISSIEDIEQLELTNFDLIDYKYHPSIKAEMAI